MTDWGTAAFEPARVAVVGASKEPGKLGHMLLTNLRGYGGEVIAVHPRERELLGATAFPTLRDAPPVDLAVVATPPTAVPEVLADCAAARVRVALILTGGFAETGPDGAALQERALRAAREGGVRIIGPNCFGLIDVRHGLNASMGLGMPLPGGVSLFTQSGAYGMAATSRSQDGSIGFARVLAGGNAIDIGAAEALRCFAADPETRVIALFLEAIRDGAALIAAAREAARRKPVVAVLVGRREAGRRAAASHTAALAGDARVAIAALRQAGVHVVEDGRTLFDVAAALDRQGPLRGPRVAVITNSGGTGVELADLLEEERLEVPRLSPELELQIAAELPPHASAANPVDVTTDWKRFPEMYGRSLRALLDAGEVDAVVAVLLQRSALSVATCDAVIAAARAGNGRPVHVLWSPPEGAEDNRRRLVDAGIPCHDGTAATARVLARCLTVTAHPAPSLGAPLERPAPADADGWLAPEAVFELLRAQGLPIAPYRLARDAAAVPGAAAELAPPVVVKALRPGIVHKRVAGAVRLGLASPAAAGAAALELDGALGPGPFLVQAQAAPGQELIVGVTRDARFGPAVLVGLGGALAEALDDVAVRIAPIDELEAAKAWSELRGHAALDDAGARAALAELTARVSQLAARAPWCRELDLNPVIACPSGLVVVDARLRVELELEKE